MTRIHGRIKNEISKALEGLGADHQLLGIVGSWGDTLSDADVLEALQAWNRGLFQMATIASTRPLKRRPKIRIVR